MERTYGATLYSSNSEDPRFDISRIPERYTIRVDVDFDEGCKDVYVYEQEPKKHELEGLMSQLLKDTYDCGFVVTRTNFGEVPLRYPELVYQ